MGYFNDGLSFWRKNNKIIGKKNVNGNWAIIRADKCPCDIKPAFCCEGVELKLSDKKKCGELMDMDLARLCYAGIQTLRCSLNVNTIRKTSDGGFSVYTNSKKVEGTRGFDTRYYYFSLHFDKNCELIGSICMYPGAIEPESNSSYGNLPGWEMATCWSPGNIINDPNIEDITDIAGYITIYGNSSKSNAYQQSLPKELQ